MIQEEDAGAPSVQPTESPTAAPNITTCVSELLLKFLNYFHHSKLQTVATRGKAVSCVNPSRTEKTWCYALLNIF